MFTQSPNWLNAAITKRNDRALQIAAAAKQVNFVRNLVDKMSNTDLELRNTSGNTAFCFAATSGVVEIAKVVVERNGELPNIRGSAGMTPLHMAMLMGHKEMVLYLLTVTHFEKLSKFDRIEFLNSSIEADLLDVALHFLEQDKTLAVGTNAKQETTEQVEENSTMAIKLVKELWGQVTKQDKEKISNLMENHGDYYFYSKSTTSVKLCLWSRFADATRIDLVSSSKSCGATAICHSRESQWRNPAITLHQEHEELRKQGEECMKTTSESCTLAVTLITTVDFTIVFIIPGGINNSTSYPILLTQAAFAVFSISNAISCFSSSVSILMFLLILTSHHSERYFLRCLDKT
ncbi:hypothetical protein Cgig2_011063 [Carnegiea gigantea]|uniref:PGG domain-containing protein n=1 Tax=Carnegiea gigantea TaxID=171969 RepID=A0A9Q1Q4K9_9CARY|nr:hypothetical protein Cgig2_011063 [Carnegiea gigantea]